MTPINIITGDWRRKKRITRITIVLPAESKMPTIRGKWQRLADGKIRAWYTPDEHEQCKKIFQSLQREDQESPVNAR